MNTKRRDALKALFATDQAPAETPAPAPEQKSWAGPGANAPADREGAAPRTRSAAVKAMGLALDGLNDQLAEAHALRKEVEESGRIVELDPALIDAAFVSDRLSFEEAGDEAFAALVESIGENGQQVPVLVRVHPADPQRFETAYGHRRIRAAARLGRPVRAIVRALSDAELVLAQGKENTERRDLSFIERAVFARKLVERGFTRKIIQEALSLHKTEMVRLLQVAEAIPDDLVRRIGPAPKIGRARWLALAKCLGSERARETASRTAGTEEFDRADSNRRFSILQRRLSAAPSAEHAPQELTDPAGRLFARVVTKGKPRIDFVGAGGAEFAALVADELPALFARFKAKAG